MATKKSAEATAEVSKLTLAESQRQGAQQRAKDAAARATAAVDNMPADSDYADIVGAANKDAQDFAFAASTASGTADVQYASRKAEEAATATVWLVTLARK